MSENDTPPAPQPSSYAEGDKNSQTLLCERCSSVILLPEKANFINKEFYLPHMKKKTATSEPGDSEALEEFWVVDDMFTFENVGFSNAVKNIKYLICADCEIGPVGWHDIQNTKAFYIALSRVKHQ